MKKFTPGRYPVHKKYRLKMRQRDEGKQGTKTTITKRITKELHNLDIRMSRRRLLFCEKIFLYNLVEIISMQ